MPLTTFIDVEFILILYKYNNRLQLIEQTLDVHK
jgi:hypothetical protein